MTTGKRQPNIITARDRFDWFERVLDDKHLSSIEVHVAAIVLRHINARTAFAYPAQPRIAGMARLSVRRVQTAIATLVDRGHLRVEVSRGRGRSSRYFLAQQKWPERWWESRRERDLGLVVAPGKGEPPCVFSGPKTRTTAHEKGERSCALTHMKEHNADSTAASNRSRPHLDSRGRPVLVRRAISPGRR